MLSLNLLILMSIFQFGQSLTLTLSELEEWKNLMKAELKLEILSNVEKTIQEIITAVQDHGIQLGSLQEFKQEVHNHTTQIESLNTEIQETSGLVEDHSSKINELNLNQNETKSDMENLSTELNRFKNELSELNKTLQVSNDALNFSITEKAHELQQLLSDIKSMHSEDKVELISNMTEMKAETINIFEDQTKALNESEVYLANIIALQATEFHRQFEEMKEDQNKNNLELTVNVTDIMDALDTEIKTEFQQQIGEIKESQRTNLLEMSKNTTEIKEVIKIDTKEVRNKLEELTSNFTEIKTEFQHQIEEVKESHNTDLLGMSKNTTEIKEAIDTDVTEAKNQLEELTSNFTDLTILIEEVKESHKTDLLEMSKNATEIKEAIDIDVTEAKNQLEELTSNITDITILITDVQMGVNECQSINRCQNGGTCLDIEIGYECQCIDGFAGIHCEVNIDECSENPCLNGTCTDGINEYSCQCEAGYFGTNCDTTCPIDKPMTKKIEDGCYFFVNEKLSFDQAKEKCKSSFDGIAGKLAEPKTKAISDRLYEESVNMFGGASSFNINDGNGGNGIWIGVTDIEVDGTFKYDSDGTLLSFTSSWSVNQPTVSTSTNCAQFFNKGEKWVVYTCAQSCFSICEMLA